MIKIVNYTHKEALRQKGWFWFGAVVGLQMFFVIINDLIYGE